MKILITGGTGQVGENLGLFLAEKGHQLVCLTRNKAAVEGQLSYPAEIIQANLVVDELSAADLTGIEGIIHLMGESVDSYWTVHKRKKIFQSRVDSSKKLVTSILKHKPLKLKWVISASAQGFYGNQGENEVFEHSAPSSDSTDFLKDVCQKWEEPFLELAPLRTVQLRLPVILDPHSGALKKMIPIFQRGLGATLGTGQQWMSWIAMSDLVRLFDFCIENSSMSGALNASSPEPIRNKDFTKALCQSLNVFEFPKAPAFALKILFGDMSSILLGSIKLNSKKLVESGFQFEFENLQIFLSKNIDSLQKKNLKLLRKQYLPFPTDVVFQFFSEAKNLEQITPEFLQFRVLESSTEALKKGTLINYKLKLKGIPFHWRTLIEEWNPPDFFIDSQIKGPYKLWRHKHSFVKLGNGTLMIDEVDYRLPFSFVGYFFVQSFVQKDVETIFSFRKRVVAKMQF